MKKNQKNIVYILLALIICCIAVFSALYFQSQKNNDLNDTSVASSVTVGTSEKITTKKEKEVTEKSEFTSGNSTTESDSETTVEQTSQQIANQITEAEETSNEVTTESKSIDPLGRKVSEAGRIIVEIDENDPEWNLIVVNSKREIPEGYKPKLTEVVGSGYELDYRVAPHYEEMYYAAKEDGIILTPYSGYRSYERQEINYTNLTNQYMSQYSLNREDAAKKAATVILPPGTSEHNLGLAMDICNTYDSFAYTDEYAWLMKNAYKYGFILRYTAEKQSITGIVPEPWHWRYVGVEYAKKIKDSGLCLEEYLESIGKTW